MPQTAPRTGYAPVNGLQMYYEIHGEGEPLLLLHGSFYTIELWGPLLASLAEQRQVIAVEQQGHGHTADIDRPLGHEQMADDTAALMRHLGIEQADVFGYSMGGITALGLAIRHPDLVRKLALAGTIYHNDGYFPESRAVLETLTPELFAGTPVESAYQQAAPNPEAFPSLVTKVKELHSAFPGWQPNALRAIVAPALVVNGDADIRPEHAVELFRLLGGGVPGDLVGLPPARLAILPGTTHVGLITQRLHWLRPMLEEFLEAPLQEGQ